MAGEAIVGRCGILIGALLLGFFAVSKATPANSADVIYIDGSPCNQFCQFYLARSRAALLRKLADDHEMKGREAALRLAGLDRLARVAAAHNEISPTRTAALQRAIDPETRRGESADMRAGFTGDSRTMTIRDHLIAATAVAEQLTAAVTAASELRMMNGDHPIASVPDGGRSDLASANQTDAQVIVVISRSEIKTLGYLTRANIAIDGERSATAQSVQMALWAAGAANVQVLAGKRKAIDRLVTGEVPAAVLTLVSADVAKAFPEIEGFKIFRIPLPPRS
jgi:hypothetical protein